ncbi:hypothetical protein SBA4_1230009 [Candidatus Sulfopaludibacter sp. SbA4]|nr:hypothetical protein SBA4_1230009 [Candidatus Sulfopaludibacter sp. SbA4]
MGGIRMGRGARWPAGPGDRAHGNDAGWRNLAGARVGAGADGAAGECEEAVRDLERGVYGDTEDGFRARAGVDTSDDAAR